MESWWVNDLVSLFDEGSEGDWEEAEEEEEGVVML